MSIQGKILRLIFMGMGSLFFSLSPVLVEAAATTTPQPTQIIANVYIRNPIVVQSGNTLNVLFTLGNGTQTGSQADVRYGIELLKAGANGSQMLADEYIATEDLSLAGGQSVQRSITYTPPPYLSGSYQVWVIAENSSGLPFSAVPAGGGNVVLTAAKGGYAQILPSCLLSVSGDSQQYTPDQGVDVLPSETLLATCQITSKFTTTQTVYPHFETLYRSEFGNVVPTQGQATGVTLTPGQTKAFAFIVPLPQQPQAYDARLTLVTASSSNAVSNTIVFHYVVRGPSATIQNASLDKNQYSAGDTAQALVTWSPSADDFPNSRLGSTTPLGNLTLGLSLTGNGVQCAQTITQQVPESGTKASLSLPITASCVNPTLHVSLKDSSGNFLDQKQFVFNSNIASTSPSTLQKTIAWISIIVLGAAIVLLLLEILWKRHKAA